MTNYGLTLVKVASITVFSAGAIALPVVVAAQDVDPVLTYQMDAALDAAINEKRIVGAVVLVSRDGELIYHRAVGMADRENGIEMTEDHLFRLASVSKPVVTAAAMRLVDQGVLDLDDPVTAWLPEFQPRFGDHVPVITLRQLLSHTSGIGYPALEGGEGPYTQAGVQDGTFGTGISLEENLERLASAPLKAAPGTAFVYGLGIDVVGRVIEIATNLPLEVAVRELVTGPLGMEDTRFHVPVWEEDHLSVNYRDARDGEAAPVAMNDREILPLVGLMNARAIFEPNRVTDPDAWPSSGAGMTGSAEDILDLLEAFDAREGFLSDAALETMLTPVIGAEAQANGPGWGFGVGGAILIEPAGTRTPQPKGTFSWSGAYGHNWFVDPETDTVFVALTNTAWEGLYGKFSMDTRNAVYGQFSP